jgi:hypothetical protein
VRASPLLHLATVGGGSQQAWLKWDLLCLLATLAPRVPSQNVLTVLCAAGRSTKRPRRRDARSAMEGCGDCCRGCFPVPNRSPCLTPSSSLRGLTLTSCSCFCGSFGSFVRDFSSSRVFLSDWCFDADGMLQTTDCILLVGPVRSLFDSNFVAVCLCAACD